MYSRKCLSVLSVFVFLLVAGCSDTGLDDPESAGYKSVDLPSTLYSYAPDSASLAELNRIRHSGGLATQEALPKGRAIAQKIDPARVEVMVSQYVELSEDGWDEYNAFEGSFWVSRDRSNWDDQVEYVSSSPFNDLIYHGTLEVSGDFATGSVLVREGYSNVEVGFIKSDGTYISAFAEYYWNYSDLDDGWYVQGMKVDVIGTEGTSTEPML